MRLISPAGSSALTNSMLATAPGCLAGACTAFLVKGAELTPTFHSSHSR